MLYVIEPEKRDEVLNDIKMTKERNLENLKKASTKINDIILHSPQQLPIIFLIQKELNSFNKNIDDDYNNYINKNIINIININNNEFPTNDSINIIDKQSNKLYNIFDSMYKEYFHNQIKNIDISDEPIIKVIKDSENLIDLTKKNRERTVLKINPQQNSPKYWPLRIREALLKNFIFDSSQQIDEAIEYFETNYQILIFISKLKRASDELVNLYKLIFFNEESNLGKQSKIPKKTRIDIQTYVNRLFEDLKNPKSSSEYVCSINSKVDFNMFTEAVKK